MLAERKKKIKWSLNPRGNLWSQDTNKFGQRMLEKMGWKSGSGLGVNEQGITEHIKVAYKSDTKCIGYKDHGEEWVEQQSQFESLLAELSNAHDPTVSGTSEKGIGSLEQRSRQSRARVHYQKFTRGKDLSKYSDKDLVCILGVKKSESNILDSRSTEQKNDTEQVTGQVDYLHGVTTVNGGTMSDYFTKIKHKSILKSSEAHENGKESDIDQTNDKPKLKVKFEDSSELNDKTKKKKKQKLMNRDSTCLYAIDDEIQEIEESKAKDESLKKEKKRKRKTEKQIPLEDEIISDVNKMSELNCPNSHSYRSKMQKEQGTINHTNDAPVLLESSEVSQHEIELNTDLRKLKKKKKVKEINEDNDANTELNNHVKRNEIIEEESEDNEYKISEKNSSKKKKRKSSSDETIFVPQSSEDKTNKEKCSKEECMEQELCNKQATDNEKTDINNRMNSVRTVNVTENNDTSYSVVNCGSEKKKKRKLFSRNATALEFENDGNKNIEECIENSNESKQKKKKKKEKEVLNESATNVEPECTVDGSTSKSLDTNGADIHLNCVKDTGKKKIKEMKSDSNCEVDSTISKRIISDKFNTFDTNVNSEKDEGRRKKKKRRIMNESSSNIESDNINENSENFDITDTSVNSENKHKIKKVRTKKIMNEDSVNIDLDCEMGKNTQSLLANETSVNSTDVSSETNEGRKKKRKREVLNESDVKDEINEGRKKKRKRDVLNESGVSSEVENITQTSGSMQKQSNFISEVSNYSSDHETETVCKKELEENKRYNNTNVKSMRPNIAKIVDPSNIKFRGSNLKKLPGYGNC